MFRAFAITLPLMFCACAAAPTVPFQKLNDGHGYTIKELSGPTHLLVQTQLPPGVSSEFAKNYATRAIGEECAQRGFSYFDEGRADGQSVEGFCLSREGKLALAITFAKPELEQTPPRFVVEHLNEKSETNLKPGDEVLQIGTQPLGSIAQVKGLVHRAAAEGRTAMSLVIVREGKRMKVTEPLAELSGGVYRPFDLESLRARTQ
ncbi:MAG TPA: hypothetical protein VFV50_14575 [Bdellovibrionales bacterium]|nr:hypothetical protein [Bdellovibrionales bacterium]